MKEHRNVEGMMDTKIAYGLFYMSSPQPADNSYNNNQQDKSAEKQ